jgi:diguanylate cyclase
VSGPTDPNTPGGPDDARPGWPASLRFTAASDSAVVPQPIGWTDAISGAEGPKYWDRLVSGEGARLHREGRPVTVALLELVGCEELAALAGLDAALQTFVRLSRALVSQIRSSDHIARIGRHRFALLLTDTSEIEALNFIDRVLRSLNDSIEREAREIRIGVGWASSANGGELPAAIALAEERLATDFFHTL